MLNKIQKLWAKTKNRRRVQMKLLFLLMLVTAFFEILSIGSIIPFLAAITDPSIITKYDFIENILISLNINTQREFIKIFTIVFCIAAVLASFMRLILLYSSSKISHMIGAEFGFDIYKKTLYQPYSIHVTRNSSEIISVISVKVQMIIVNVISALLAIITSLILAITILSFLIYMNPYIAISVIIFFGSLYSLLTFLSRREVLRGGESIANEATQIVKTLQEGLGAIRDIILDGNHNLYRSIYEESELNLRKAQIKNQVIRESPRFIMEGIAMVGIACLAFFLTSDGGVSNALPMLGVVAIGSQRLLPLIQNGYNAIIKLRGSEATINDVLYFLEQQDPPSESKTNEILSLKSNISLESISFKYLDDGPEVINNLSLTIKYGERIGFIGETGSGKSTLIDLVMGLLSPLSGHISIDGKILNQTNLRKWQNNIAHVPQSIYLSDQSIRENIAFGIPKNEIDFDRVLDASRKAEIHGFVKKMPNKYETKIGERGVMLSGGQKQRLGIARALYKDVSLMVLDEATSALDQMTENKIMNTFHNLEGTKTILMIAHRITTLKDCDRIFEISSNGAKEISYKYLIDKTKV
jgi:ATP-binding cassette subfamily B protein